MLEAEHLPEKGKIKINPKDNHISFQCSDMDLIMKQLEEMEIEYVKAVVREGGIIVDQIFFHDPDGYMVEICNCQNIPVLPLVSSCPFNNKMPIDHNPNITSSSSFYGKNKTTTPYCSGQVEALMMENLAMDMLNIFI